MGKFMLAVLTASAVTAAMADSQPAEGVPSKVSDPRMLEMFNRHKTLESESHRARIQLLQEAEACIQASASPHAFRSCERHEREAREAIHNQHRARMEALRAEYRQFREQHREPAMAPERGPVQ